MISHYVLGGVFAYGVFTTCKKRQKGPSTRKLGHDHQWKWANQQKIKWRIAETLKQKRNSDFYLLLWTETRFLSVFCILTYACGKKMTPPGLLQSCCEYFQVQQYWHWRLTTFCIPVRSEAKTWATFLVFQRQGRKECQLRRNNPKLRSTMFLWSSTRFCVVNFGDFENIDRTAAATSMWHSTTKRLGNNSFVK